MVPNPGAMFIDFGRVDDADSLLERVANRKRRRAASHSESVAESWWNKSKKVEVEC